MTSYVWKGTPDEEGRQQYANQRVQDWQRERVISGVGVNFHSLLRVFRLAGVMYDNGERLRDVPMAREASRPIKHNRESLIEKLRALGAQFGYTPGVREINAAGAPHHVTYYRHFGSLRAAQIAAGLNPNEIGGRGHRSRAAA